MKIEVNNKEQNTEIEFPCLMESKSGKVYLILTLTEGGTYKGTCLNNGNYSSYWGIDGFKPFNGTITLSND
jgi:hypothetical protein